jgi:PAS domain-containing protein
LGFYRYFDQASFSTFYREHTAEFYSALIIICALLTVSLVLAYLYQHTKRVKESLLKSEKKLSDITSSLAEGIFVMDETGCISFMNPEAERILGWTMAELMNKNAHEVIHFARADGSSLSFEECGLRNVIRTADVRSALVRLRGLRSLCPQVTHPRPD